MPKSFHPLEAWQAAETARPGPLKAGRKEGRMAGGVRGGTDDSGWREARACGMGWRCERQVLPE